ncbi:MAG: hypothetical protein P4L40_26245 [Terracidiphilus sp.]|nr:hypothetical protein [Terracidiphilus sp.]
MNHIHAKWHLAVLLLLCAGIVAGQQSQSAKRAIVDPATGQRWMLIANPSFPGGPGLIIPDSAIETHAATVERHAVGAQPVIRAGDRVSIEESSPSFSAHYTAIALVPAALGKVFLARLAAGMAPVRVVAVGPGRAAFASASPSMENRP